MTAGGLAKVKPIRQFLRPCKGIAIEKAGLRIDSGDERADGLFVGTGGGDRLQGGMRRRAPRRGGGEPLTPPLKTNLAQWRLSHLRRNARDFQANRRHRQETPPRLQGRVARRQPAILVLRANKRLTTCEWIHARLKARFGRARDALSG